MARTPSPPQARDETRALTENAQIIPDSNNFRFPIADFEQILTTENMEHAEARTVVASLTSLRPL